MASMTSDVVRHLGFAQKVFKALEGAGFSPTELNLLAEDPTLLRELRHMLQQKFVGGKVHTVPQTACDDFELEIYIQNRHITSRMVKKGFVHRNNTERPSTSALADKLLHGKHGPGWSGVEQQVQALVGFKALPTDENHEWKPMVLEIAKVLDAKPEELFPGSLKYRLPPKRWIIMYGKIGQPIALQIMN